MKVMIIGSGGREHAITESIAKSKRVSKIFVSPGNPGMKGIAETIKANDFNEIYHTILDKHIDLVFIGPEQPLQDGLADYLEDKGVTVIGPSRIGAQLETSKAFAKSLMQKYNIPTAEYCEFSDHQQAVEYIRNTSFPTVIKADGLAAGKGVFIAQNYEEALSALQKIMLNRDFGNAGKKIIIEEFLSGFEASIFAFTDGRSYQTTILSHDYKKIFAGDKGPNTGGMGAFAPVRIDQTELDQIEERIFKPLLKGLKCECIEYKGVIYAGLIFTPQGIKVLEFNCRLGDPETQAVLPLLETDLVDICEAIAFNKVDTLQLTWKDMSAVTVVAASEGYPGKSETGQLITIDPSLQESDFLKIFYSNVTQDREKRFYTSGGRVLTLTALAPTISEARDKVYENLNKIKFSNIYYRHDIGLLKP